MWRHTPIISAFWKQRQEDSHEFKVSLATQWTVGQRESYRLIPCLRKLTEMFVNRSLSRANVISSSLMAFSRYEFKITLKILVIEDHLTNSL